MFNFSKFLNCKKGLGEKIVSIWWFFILMIIGLGIVAGVSLFFSAEVDARNFESFVLNEKVSSCLIEQGFIDNDLITDEDFNFFEYCSINENLFVDGSSYYLKLVFYDEDDSENLVLESGRKSYAKDCALQLGDGSGKSVEYSGSAQCNFRNESVWYYDYGVEGTEILQGRLEILSGSNQIGNEVNFGDLG